MQTVINNNERVFQVVTSTGKQVFCNLAKIKSVIASIEAIEGYYKIFHVWNNRLQKCSKKYLNELYTANSIDAKNTILTIDIQAKEWFDKVNGNSYHAGQVTVNFNLPNEKTYNFPLSYGYDSMYIQTAFKTLANNSILDIKDLSEHSAYIKNNGIKINCSIKRDCKKSELNEYK